MLLNLGTCEIETRSAGSGVPTSKVSGGKLCWYWKKDFQKNRKYKMKIIWKTTLTDSVWDLRASQMEGGHRDTWEVLRLGLKFEILVPDNPFINWFFCCEKSFEMTNEKSFRNCKAVWTVIAFRWVLARHTDRFLPRLSYFQIFRNLSYSQGSGINPHHSYFQISARI